jgi:hypothetical protein
MNNKIKYIASALLVLSSASYSFGQVTATASASATIITPISISKTVDMNFGNVAVSAVAGTVVLSTTGNRTTSGGVTLPAINGTVKAASFTVNGLSGTTYTITLPSTATILSSGANNMSVTAFNSTPSSTGLLTGGTQIVTVGATLTVSANQAAGDYTSATPFTMTVNYN